MLDENELQIRRQALRGMMQRGRISDRMLVDNADKIAEIMTPLPPPSEWERWRGLTKLTAVDMESITGVPRSRVRFWEEGGGSTDPGLWVDYANALVNTVSKVLSDIDAASILAPRAEVESPSVRALTEQLRVAVSALGMWIDQGGTCSDSDMQALHEAARGSRRKLFRNELALKKRVQGATQGAGDGEQEKEGRQ
jgi:hypothetical protein